MSGRLVKLSGGSKIIMKKNEKFFLVTGANSDIGFQTCKLILKEKHKLLALFNKNSNNIDLLEDKNLTKAHVNFSSHNSVEKFIDKNSDLLKKIDVFISLASMRKNNKYGSITTKDLIDHFLVNTVPEVLFTQFLGPNMAKRNWGRIIVAGSIGVKFGGGRNSYPYSVSKSACEIIPNIAKEWAKKNVLTNVVRVGDTATSAYKSNPSLAVEKRVSMIPMKRFANPIEIAEFIYWLSSEKNSYITNELLSISGGE